MDLFLYYESFLEKLDSLGLEYYLLGDFNCNLSSAQYDLNTRRLCEISDLFGLQQLITEPTRITESSSTLIDLIYTNYVDRVACSGVLGKISAQVPTSLCIRSFVSRKQ